MQRWNPYETVLSVNNVGSLQLKWKKPTGGNYNYAIQLPAVQIPRPLLRMEWFISAPMTTTCMR